jgi:hypothetical protein
VNASAIVRPLGVTILSWIFVAVGAGGFVAHALPLAPAEHVEGLASGLLAIAAGIFMLRGRDWARWLAMAWMAFHVVLSLAHSPVELAVHALMFAVILAVLLRPPASAYFRAHPRGHQAAV